MNAPQFAPTRDFTLIIPTRNRPGYLQRCLEFYASRRFPHRVLVLDSSSHPHRDEVSALPARFSRKLDIELVVYPYGIGFSEKVLDGIRRALSPFVGFCADDDFVLPGSIDRSLQFLRANPDYAAATGSSVGFTLAGPSREDSDGRIFVTSYPRARPISQPFANRRLRSFWRRGFILFYGVVRRPAAVDAWSATARLLKENPDASPEVLSTCLLIISGKVQGFPQTHLLHEAQSGQTSRSDPTLRDMAASGLLDQQRRAFEHELVRALCMNDGLPTEDARRTAQWVWRAYSAPGLAGRKTLRRRLQIRWAIARDRLGQLLHPMRLIVSRERNGTGSDGLRAVVRGHVAHFDWNPDFMDVVKVIRDGWTRSEQPRDLQSKGEMPAPTSRGQS